MSYVLNKINRLTCLLVTLFSIISFSSLAQEEDVNFNRAIANAAVFFSQNGREIEQYLRGSSGWSSFQEGTISGMQYGFDPDGNASFGVDLNHDDVNYSKVICSSYVSKCKIEKDLHYPFEISVHNQMMKGGALLINRGNTTIADISVAEISSVIMQELLKDNIKAKLQEKPKLKREIKTAGKVKPKAVLEERSIVALSNSDFTDFEGVRCFTLFDLVSSCADIDVSNMLNGATQKFVKTSKKDIEWVHEGTDKPIIAASFVPIPKRKPIFESNPQKLIRAITFPKPRPDNEAKTNIEHAIVRYIATALDHIAYEIKHKELEADKDMNLMLASAEKAEPEKKAYIEALEKLPAVYVFTDFLAEPDHLKGKFRDRVNMEIRKRLLNAGIRPLGKEEVEKYPHAGRLEAYFSKANKETGCTFGVWLSLRQPMQLQRSNNVQVLASTWGGGGAKRSEFKDDSEYQTIMFYVDEFVKQYRLANDPKFREKQLALATVGA